MKLRYLIYTLILIGFGSLVAYRIVKNKSEFSAAGNRRGGAGGKDAPAIRVEGVVVAPGKFENSLSVSGSIQANEQVQIRSEISGLVRSINFKEGAQVSKGQVLLTIDDSELRAQLAQAVTKEELSAENERRAKLLLEKEAISREEYDTNLADLHTAQAQTRLIRAQLDKTKVLAPFTGKIGLRSISAGEYLTPATTVANLLSTNPVKIQFSVPEKYSGQMNTNGSITFTVAGRSDKFSAKIYAIEPGIDAQTRTLQVRALADNPAGKLVPGSFASIDLPLTSIPDAILIPTQAVVPVLNGKKVYLSENGRVKEAMIETTARTDKDVLVTSGLKPGDTVLTSGVMSLKADARVNVNIKGSKAKAD
jgi:membrane fusion protein (multidrug efflux system)